MSGSSDFTSIVFYIAIFAIVLFCFHKGEKSEKDRMWSYAGLVVLILVSGLRFDIGNDYQNYYYSLSRTINMVKIGSMRQLLAVNFLAGNEPATMLLCFIFQSFRDGFAWVLAVYSTVTIYLWYKILQREKGLFWGFFIIIVFGILFTTYDQVRQAMAVTLMIYAIKYVESGRLNKFLLCFGIAFCVHYSALFVGWCYLLKFVRPRVKIYIALILVLYAGFVMGVWSKFLPRIFQIADIYAGYASNKKYVMVNETSSGLGFLAKVLLMTFVMYKTAKRKPLIANYLFVGICAFIFASGNLNMWRMAYYFTWAIIPGFPIAMKAIPKKQQGFKIGLALFLSAWFIYDMTKDSSGCIPYDSVFSENFEFHNLRDRTYMK